MLNHLLSWFGVSIITVDGQTFDYGDCDLPFSIQSCIKPLVYSMAIEELGYGLISLIHTQF
jgi:glutaminase